MKKNNLLLLLLIFLANNIYAQVSSSLSISDTRSINDLPNFFQHGIRADFKERNVIGVPGQGAYSTNLTFAQWDNWNNSGGKNHQLNFNDGGIFYRNANSLDAQWDSWRQILMVNENGHVGIGITTPIEQLEIGGESKLNIKIGLWATIGTTGGGIATIIGNNVKASQTTDNKMEFITSTNDGAKAIKLQYNEGITFHTMLGNVNANSSFSNYERMRIDNNGNVGIGTTNPTSKLTVAGNINSREVKVTVDAGADFVFESDYDLPSLTFLEKYIKENKHLPEIASAKEMQASGINLSEMNIKLLQKMEEMTLYMIEQEKKNNKQSKEIETLKKENESFKTLSERLSMIEEQLIE
jgi:hypothetical protein